MYKERKTAKSTGTGRVNRMLKEELERELAARGLPTDGDRDELRARLLRQVQSESRTKAMDETEPSIGRNGDPVGHRPQMGLPI